MSRARSKVHLSRSLLVGRPRHTVTFILFGILLGVVAVGAATIFSAVKTAVSQTALSNIGDRNYVLETDDDQALAVLGDLTEVSPIVDSSGYVTVDAGSLDVSIRVTDDPSLVLGALVAGSGGHRADDVLVSRSVAEVLQINLGDRIELFDGAGEPISASVVGIIVNPAEAGARTVQLIGEPAQVERANRWVTDEDPYLIPELTDFIEANIIATASKEGVEEAALENIPPSASSLRFVPYVGSILLLVAVGTFVASLSRKWQSDVAALDAARVSTARGWRLIGSVVTLTIFFGTLLGSCLAFIGIYLARTQVAGVLGQDWVRVPIPYLAFTWLTGLIVGCRLIAIPLVRRLSTRRKTARPTVRLPRVIYLVAGLLALVSLIIVLDGAGLWRNPPTETTARTFLASCVLIGSGTFAASRLVGSGLPRAMKTFIQHLTSSTVTIYAIATTIAFAAGTWSALEFTDASIAEQIDAGSAQPAGSLVINAMPNSVIQQLHDRYVDLGGPGLVSYELTSDTGASWRATTGDEAQCVQDHGATIDALPECIYDLRSVAIDSASTTHRASPSLMIGNQIGLVGIEPPPDQGLSTHVLSADPEPNLGYLLPGLVLAGKDSLVAELEIHGSGRSMVILSDFSDLSVMDRLELRSNVLALSPTAALSDATLPSTYDHIRANATAVALSGAVIVMLVLLIGGAALVLAQQSTRRTLEDIGVTPLLRIGLATRWVATPIAFMLVGLLLTMVVATRQWTHPLTTLGWYWLTPYLGGLAASAIIARAFLNPPPPISE